MRAPAFWWREGGTAASALLWPAAALYGAIAARRAREAGQAAPIPVVCIGNVTVGGTGKTPAAIAVAEILRAAGRRPAFLLRGYGSRLGGPLRVDLAIHDARAVGDEALLLARHGPTIVSRDRPAGAALAAREGSDVLVMDDGLQNPSLAKDLTIAVFDAGRGVGNGLVLPAGPLRAPLSAQWPLVDRALLVGHGARAEAILDAARSAGVPVDRADLVPDPDMALTLAGRRVLAFAGIGDPDKFVRTLRAAGAEIAAVRPFPDHHPYRPSDLARLRADAARLEALLITTEKDRVRIADGTGIATLPVALRWRAEEALRADLLAMLTRYDPTGEGRPSARSTAAGDR